MRGVFRPMWIRMLRPFRWLILVCALMNSAPASSAERVAAGGENLDPAAFEHFVNGDLYELARDLDRAIQEYEKARALQPEVSQIRLALAQVYLKVRRVEQAKAELLGIEPKDALTHNLLGECYRALGQTDSAIAAYSSAVELDSMDVASLWRLAEAWQVKQNLAKVIFYTRKLASLQSLSVPVHLQLASLLFHQKNYDEAIAEYKKVLEIRPHHAKALSGMGQSYEAKGDLDGAIETYQTFLELEPDDQQLRNRLISLFYQAGRTEEAVKEAEKLSIFSPTNLNAQKRLGLLYIVQGDFDRAESLFVSYLQENPDDAEAHFHLGKIALEKQDMERAKSEFQMAVSMEDSVPDGWINLAWVYLQQDSIQKAVEVYRTGIEKVRDKVALQLRLGSIYAEQRQYDSAVVVLTKASDKMPHDIRILFALGSTYEQSGDFDRAVATFERLLRIDPEHAASLNYLGYMLADKGIKLEESLEMIVKALEHEPENGAYLDSYGWVLFRLGRMEEAEAQLKKALETLNDDPIIYEHLGDVYNAMGESEKAKTEWKKALGLDPENQQLKEKLRER